MKRIALIGAGSMAKIHANAYAGIENAELVSVFDVSEKPLEWFAENQRISCFTDFDKMLESVECDIVDICVPTYLHKEYTIRSAEKKKHILLEKPMALSTDDCNEMIAATKANGVSFMVAQVVRFFQEFAQARSMVISGAVGNPAVVRMSRGGNPPKGWFFNSQLSGGVMLDLMVHDIDWLLWTFGPVDRIFAESLAGRNIADMDYALVILRFESGVTAHLESNWAHSPDGFGVSFEIVGDKGLLDFNSHSTTPLKVLSRKKSSEDGGTVVPSISCITDPYYLELKHFVDCVEDGVPPSVSPYESMDAVRVALAAVKSAGSGMPVSIGALECL